jgi:hypothetical protein
MQKSGAWGRTRRGSLIVLMMTTMISAGCGGGGGGGGSSAPAGNSSGNGANKAPTITGAPAGEAQVGATYAMKPQAQDEDGDTLAFAIQNKPAWAVFNTTTGELTGAPRSEDVGVHAGVTISVSDGVATVSLAPFSINVGTGTPVATDGGSVALTWEVPTTTVSGGALADLAGYRIHYGRKADALTDAIEVPSAGLNHYVVSDLKKGTYYFVVRAVTASGAHSDISNVVSKVVG